MKAILISLVFFISSISFATNQRPAEEIFGYLPTNNGVLFQVESGGCTQNRDFIFELRRNQFFRVTEVTLVRIRPDYCLEYLPMGIKLKFSYKQMGILQGEKFLVINPLRSSYQN